MGWRSTSDSKVGSYSHLLQGLATRYLKKGRRYSLLIDSEDALMKPRQWRSTVWIVTFNLTLTLVRIGRLKPRFQVVSIVVNSVGSKVDPELRRVSSAPSLGASYPVLSSSVERCS